MAGQMMCLRTKIWLAIIVLSWLVLAYANEIFGTTPAGWYFPAPFR